MERSVVHNSHVRIGAFEFLDTLKIRHGDALPRAELVRGFDFSGARVPLMGPQGIFKPKLLSDAPLSITTAPIEDGKPRPYEDELDMNGLIRYKYRGQDPQHHENVGLRRAMAERIPLVYFVGLVPGLYAAEYPAYIVGDEPRRLTFTVAIDEGLGVAASPTVAMDDTSRGRRAYITSVVQRRVHQQGFRERVLAAYEQCCAACRLRHRPLLDAAHILPDNHPKGEPHVTNGLALCKIHHAAYDHNILGIGPDLIMHIRADVLEEHDGPMLRHGLQELHGHVLKVIPRGRAQRPNPDFLGERFAAFLATPA